MPRRVPQTDFSAALHVLTKADIDFIVIGALAGIAHGLGRATYDVDVVYSRTPENMRKIVQALAPLRPYLRGAPPGLPFSFDERAIRDGLNFTLLTSIGGIDLLGEVAGGGTHENLRPFADRVSAFGSEFLALGLDKLIELKRAAGRPKDYEMIAQLEALRQERERDSG